MIYTKPDKVPSSVTPYTNIKIGTCDDSNIEFFLLNDVPIPTGRRYCNKILVHECVPTPQYTSMELDGAIFMATSDPCYSKFEFYKTTEDEDNPIILMENADESSSGSGEIVSVLVQFGSDEVCCKPLRLAYRLYGIIEEERILLAQGVMNVVPCSCCGCDGKTFWTGVKW